MSNEKHTFTEYRKHPMRVLHMKSADIIYFISCSLSDLYCTVVLIFHVFGNHFIHVFCSEHLSRFMEEWDLFGHCVYGVF